MSLNSINILQITPLSSERFHIGCQGPENLLKNLPYPRCHIAATADQNLGPRINPLPHSHLILPELVLDISALARPGKHRIQTGQAMVFKVTSQLRLIEEIRLRAAPAPIRMTGMLPVAGRKPGLWRIKPSIQSPGFSSCKYPEQRPPGFLRTHISSTPSVDGDARE